MSLNVFKAQLDQIVGPKGNKEFNDLITVMGCNVGIKFDINKMNYDKIIIASDADVDGFFIRSLLLAFYFKLFPEIIQDGRLYIAEPPLYRVSDKNNPFVINMTDYINRYVKLASKNYKLGYKQKSGDIDFINKEELTEFLSETATYTDDIKLLVNHYIVNDRLLEMVLEEFAFSNFDLTKPIDLELQKLNVQHLMNRLGTEFNELFFDDKDNAIKGTINAVYQELELSEYLIKKSIKLITIIRKWMHPSKGSIVLKDIKTGTEYNLSLLEILKILKKYQPNIEHRFKGLGENSADDIKETIMDPNTRSLIKVTIGDIENDMKVFQMLRGNGSIDVLNRKALMKSFDITKDMIDT